ncbi:MAG: glycosyltransferase 87 family protein [Candidatus Bathyarchaeia archaeon]
MAATSHRLGLTRSVSQIIAVFLAIRLLWLGVAFYELSIGTRLIRIDSISLSSFDLTDIGRYYLFASHVINWGKIAYVNLPYGYPQLAGYLFLLIHMLCEGMVSFVLLLALVQLPLELLTSLIIYKLASQVIGKEKAMVPAVVYNLSPMVLYTWVARFDCIPAFFSVAALYLFLRKRYSLAFLFLGIGTMFKWFPGLLGIPFICYMLQNNLSTKRVVYSFLTMAAFCSLISLPFLILGPETFLRSFGRHLEKGWFYESLWTLVGLVIMKGLPSEYFMPSQYTIYSTESLILQAIGCILVLFLSCKERRELIGCSAYILLVFVFFVKFFSPQYVVWFSPLLLLWVNKKLDWLTYAGIHTAVYLEYPVFWNLHNVLNPPYFYIIIVLRLFFTAVAIALILSRLKVQWPPIRAIGGE